MQMRGEQKQAIKASAMAFFIIVSLVVSATGAETGEWIKFRNNEQRTGFSNLTSNIISPKVKWSFETQGPVKSPTTVADINGDGENEVIFGSNDGHLYVLDRFGSKLWDFPTIGPVINQPTIGDVDGDDLPEIVFGGYHNLAGDPNLYVLNAEDGSLLWHFESGMPGDLFRGFQASPLLHDITGDGVQDILIGSMDYHFYCFDGPTGSIIWKSAKFQHFVRASSPIGDLDGDGDLEIVVIDNYAEARVYHARTGALIWTRDLGHHVEATPVIANLDADPQEEIVFFIVGDVNLTGDVIVLNHDGSELWRSSEHTYFYTSPAVLDVDGDSNLDIIGGDTNDHTIIAYKGHNGAILWETVLPGSTWSQGDLVCCDIDSDGEIEVICGAFPNLYCLNTVNGDIEWTFATTDHIWGEPTIADLEKDGLAEILFGCYDNFLYVLENQFNPPKAGAGSHQTVDEGDTVLFDSSDSYDPDGAITIYEWDFDSRDGLWWETGAYPDSMEPMPSHIYGDNGIFTATLRVTDDHNLTDTDTCNITVLNVEPSVSIDFPSMDCEISLRVAGSKWSNIALTLYEDNITTGYLEVERWPGPPSDNPTYSDPVLPTNLNLTRSYSAVVTYDPYPDSGDEIKGDQPNNGKDPQNNAGNPVWIIITFQDGSSEKLHHTFNTQQSKKRDSNHPNHAEPWEVDISRLLIGHPFEIDGQVTDPGSDDIILNICYGTQNLSFEYLNDPPLNDPYPSPEVNPVDLLVTETMTYEGLGILELLAEDDDGGISMVALDIM